MRLKLFASRLARSGDRDPTLAAFATFSVTGISKDAPGMTSNDEASVTVALLSLNERLIESVSALSPVYLPVIW